MATKMNVDNMENHELGRKHRRNMPFLVFKIPLKIGLPLISILYIGSIVGQNVMLPLAIRSLGKNVGEYFVFWFESLLFNVIFWPIVFLDIVVPFLVKLVYPKMGKTIIYKSMAYYCLTRHWKFMLTGFFDAANGLLVCYTVALNRTSGPLQNFIMQSGPLFTLVLSFVFLRLKFSWRHMTGLCLIFIGIIIGLVPVLVEGEFRYKSIVFPIFLFVAMAPLSAMNVTMDSISRGYKHWFMGRNPDFPEEEFVSFNYSLILAFESFYQLICASILFEVDLLPYFGTSKSIGQFLSNFANGLTSVFLPLSNPPDSYFAALLCFGFALCYCLTYYFNQNIMDVTSAVFSTFLACLAPVIAVVFWFCLPAIGQWAGESAPSPLTMVMTLAAFFPIVCGSVAYAQEREDRWSWKGVYSRVAEALKMGQIS